MLDNGLHRTMLRALDGARPDSIVDVLQEVLTEHVDATEVRVLLANYQLSALRHLSGDGQPDALDESAAGDAFTTQESVVVSGTSAETQVYLPMSVGGNRIGVLQLTAPGPLAEDQLEQLTDLATLVGYALNATSNQTDLLHRAARSERMTLAAELQWQLLPARGRIAPEYQIAGHLEPAYAVYADNFDWSENEDQLLVSITDATNHARTTPLLTTLAVTAARNARRAGLGIADQACLTDQAIYAHHRGAHSVDTLLMSIDISTGQATVVKAGSPDLMLLRNGTQQSVELTEQIPLGMFEGSEYGTQAFDLVTNDRLLLMSDGVTKALSIRSKSHPHEQLSVILNRTVAQPPARVVRAIIDALIDHPDETGLTDDATVVCLDWKGPGQPTELVVTDPDIAVLDSRTSLHVIRAI